MPDSSLHVLWRLIISLDCVVQVVRLPGVFGLGLLNVLRREVNECGWGALTVKLFGMTEGTEGMRLKKSEGSSPTSSSGTWSSCECCIDWRRGCGLNWKV